MATKRADKFRLRENAKRYLRINLVPVATSAIFILNRFFSIPFSHTPFSDYAASWFGGVRKNGVYDVLVMALNNQGIGYSQVTAFLTSLCFSLIVFSVWALSKSEMLSDRRRTFVFMIIITPVVFYFFDTGYQVEPRIFSIAFGVTSFVFLKRILSFSEENNARHSNNLKHTFVNYGYYVITFFLAINSQKQTFALLIVLQGAFIILFGNKRKKLLIFACFSLILMASAIVANTVQNSVKDESSTYLGPMQYSLYFGSLAPKALENCGRWHPVTFEEIAATMSRYSSPFDALPRLFDLGNLELYKCKVKSVIIGSKNNDVGWVYSAGISNEFTYTRPFLWSSGIYLTLFVLGSLIYALTKKQWRHFTFLMLSCSFVLAMIMVFESNPRYFLNYFVFIPISFLSTLEFKFQQESRAMRKKDFCY
jgi:hypothetical protein